MPDELRQARWLLKERDEFLAEKGREADALLEEVRVQAERMVQRTEIVRQANHVAQRILDDANEEARRLRHEAEDYADQKLASFEIVLDRTMKTVQAGREKLQVTPLPKVEIGEGGDTSLATTASDGSRPGCRRARGLLRPGPRLSRDPVRTDPLRTDVTASDGLGRPDPGRRERSSRPFVVQVAALRKQAGATRHEIRHGVIDGLGAVGVLVPDGAEVAARPDPVVLSGRDHGHRHGDRPLAGRVPAVRGPGRGHGGGRGPRALRPGRRRPSQDEDAYPLAGDELDLEPLARDAVLLDLPLAPLCSDGLPRACAPGAGPTGTSQPATAPPRAAIPRWSALDVLRDPEGGRFGLGCHPYGRPEEEDLQGEEPQPPGIQLGAEGAGPLGVPPVHHRQAPPCRVPELRLVQRPTGDRSRLVARGGPRPTGEAFAALPVAVDAMGGDRAPGEIVAGARQVAEQPDIEVALVGRPGEMGDTGDLPFFPASEVIGMDDDPGQGVRRKKDSSLVRAAEAVRDGKAMAMVSAGQHRRHHGLGPAADGTAARV